MWSAAIKIAQVGTLYIIIIMYSLQVLYLPELLGLLDVLCLLKVFYFGVPIGFTVSRRIPRQPPKIAVLLLLRVKNADLYLTIVNFQGISNIAFSTDA